MKRGIVFAFAFLFLFMIIFAEAATKKEAETAINNVKEIMEEMQRAGFNIIRINDSIIEMKQSYDAQVALEEKTGKADYPSIIAVYERVKAIKEKAFLAYDEITISETKLKEMEREANMTEAWEIFEKAKKEFEDERYELVSPYTEEAYKKASELTATATKIKAVAEAARANLIYFFSANWKKLLLLLVFGVLILSFFYNRISCALTRRKINSLEIERGVIKTMIAELQRNYFSLGKVSEMDYEVRLARYTEMVRDIDRQIPLLMTELEKKSKFLKRK